MGTAVVYPENYTQPHIHGSSNLKLEKKKYVKETEKTNTA
jgi:hypothetical protein